MSQGSTDAELTFLIKGRAPAVYEDSLLSTQSTQTRVGRLLFGSGHLQARLQGNFVIVMAPLRSGEYVDLLQLNFRTFQVDAKNSTALTGFQAMDMSTHIRLECLDSLDFWCDIPYELILSQSAF